MMSCSDSTLHTAPDHMTSKGWKDRFSHVTRYQTSHHTIPCHSIAVVTGCAINIGNHDETAVHLLYPKGITRIAIVMGDKQPYCACMHA